MAGILRAAELKIEVHDDHFAQNAKDPEWLTGAGKNGWIVVTRDERIRYRVSEKQAIRRAKVRAFVLAERCNQPSRRSRIRGKREGREALFQARRWQGN
jgi:uncharacterized protein with PIN domain